MATIKIFVATEMQSEDLDRFFGRSRFPNPGVNCYAVQGSLSAIEALKQLKVHGHDAHWSEKLGAVIVVVPREMLDVIGARIRYELGITSWPSGWVTKETWKSFGA